MRSGERQAKRREFPKTWALQGFSRTRGGCGRRRQRVRGPRGDGDWGGHHGDTSALQPGATVEEAVLVLKDGRALFVKVDLDD